MTFFKTKRWKDFLIYTFHDLLGYDIIKIKTTLKCQHGFICIVVVGEIKQLQKVGKTIYFEDFYDQITDAFYKSTEEGEMIIKDIGQLHMGTHTHMKLEYI